MGNVDVKKKWLRGNRITVFYLTLFFILWEGGIRLFEVPMYLLPAPSGIAVKFVQNFPLILKYTWVTGLESFGGFLVSAAWGIPLSLIIAFSVFLRKTLYPFTVALQLVPKIALAPLFVTWFGFGLMPKFIIVFLLCFFPILLNAILGFTSLKKEHNDFALSTGADPLTVFWKVRLPAALPQIFVGLKWAAVNATVGATIGEWIGGGRGPGILHPDGLGGYENGRGLRHYRDAGFFGAFSILPGCCFRKNAGSMARVPTIVRQRYDDDEVDTHGCRYETIKL